MSDVLFNELVGEYLCEDIDVSEYDTIHVDTGGDKLRIAGRNK